MARAAQRKAFHSYERQLAGIKTKLTENEGALGKAVFDKIKRDSLDNNGVSQEPSEGNFIGLLYSLYLASERKSIPFVWGSDALVQYFERSGAEKAIIYRDQLVIEAVMEGMIDSLRKSKDTTKDATDLEKILDALRMGSEDDRPYLNSEYDFGGPEETVEENTENQKNDQDPLFTTASLNVAKDSLMMSS